MEKIERLAEDFLRRVPNYVWDGETLPVPIEEIADTHVGLLVLDVDDLGAAPGAPELTQGQSLSGLLLPAAGEIWVNAAEARQWPSRRRFTIAHELGHWRLHRDAEHAVFCRSGSIAAEMPGQRLSIPPVEDEANMFAAAVLMPVHLIQQQYISCQRDFARLCDTFGTSGAAMGRRLHATITRTSRTEGT